MARRNLLFRGPERDLDGDYLAFLGSTATFGKHVRTPFPELVGQALGVTAVNLGCINSGLDTFAKDGTIRAIVQGARATVMEVLGAHFLSNPFYAVHPRRNDRVITPTTKLRKLYPEVDFTDIHFAGHLIATLAETDPGRFGEVRATLRAAWMSRMAELIGIAGGPVCLVWASPRPLSEGGDEATGAEPLLSTGPSSRG